MTQKETGAPRQGSVSVEYLSHFRCGECNKWWSIGDVPNTQTSWFCPWCGKEQTVRDISPKNRENAVAKAEKRM